MRKEINISHMNIESMGVRDQSQVKIKFKKFKKVKSVPKDVPKSHNNDKTHLRTGTVELFFVMILTTPYAYKPMFYV